MKSSLAIILSTLILSTPAQAVSVKIFTDKDAWAKALKYTISSENFTDSTFVDGLSIKADSPLYAITGGKMIDRLTAEHSTTISYTQKLLGMGGNFDLSLNEPGMGIKLFLNGATFSDYKITTEISKNTSGGFFGIVSDTAFSSLRLMAGTQGISGVNGEQYSLDNLTLATATAPIPEPETYALMGMGLIGLLAARRRKVK